MSKDFDGLSARARNFLINNDIHNPDQLRAFWAAHGPAGVIGTQNIGRKTLNEIVFAFDLPRQKDIWEAAKTLQEESIGLRKLLHLARNAIETDSQEEKSKAIDAIDSALKRLF